MKLATILLALLLAHSAAAYQNEHPIFPEDVGYSSDVGYGFCSCPARRDAMKVQVAIFSTKPTAEHGPRLVCDCEYDDEPMLSDPRLEAVCSAWATPTEFDGVLMAPACIAQTYMTDADHRHFGPCDASCNFPIPAREAFFRKLTRRVRSMLLGKSGRSEGPTGAPLAEGDPEPEPPRGRGRGPRK